MALTGPRQTGKTTIIHKALERVDLPSRYIAVDEILGDPNSQWNEIGGSGGRAWLLDTWNRARNDAEQSERGFVLALDEIQPVGPVIVDRESSVGPGPAYRLPTASHRGGVGTMVDADRTQRESRWPLHAR